MKVVAACLGVFLLSAVAAGEDPELRATAVALLERANAVSTPASAPPYEAFTTFRFFSPGEGTKEGQRTIVWLGPKESRSEVTFGDYHLVNVITPHHLSATNEGNTPIPSPVWQLNKLQPIHLVRFDHEDVINSIRGSQVRGRPAQCIEFDTRFGSTIQNNEVCVDKENGTLVRFRNANVVTENTEFFPYGGAYWPGRIDYFRNGVEVLEIHTQLKLLEGPPDPNVLVPPPGSLFLDRCRQYRPPFAQQVFQPPAGKGGETVDLVVTGVVDEDGRLRLPVVELSDRPDLQQEALQTAAKWVFTPAMCDGKPTAREASIVLNFVGR